jgi:hypothetical protein
MLVFLYRVVIITKALCRHPAHGLSVTEDFNDARLWKTAWVDRA